MALVAAVGTDAEVVGGLRGLSRHKGVALDSLTHLGGPVEEEENVVLAGLCRWLLVWVGRCGCVDGLPVLENSGSKRGQERRELRKPEKLEKIAKARETARELHIEARSV